MRNGIARGAVAVAVASVRATSQHMQRAAGGRGRLWAFGLAVAGVFVAANIAIASFYETTFGVILLDSSVLPEDVRSRLLGTFVAGTSLTSAALAMLIVMIAPPVSRVTVAARIAGLPGAAAGVGEFLPQMAALLLIVPATGGAAIGVLSAHQVSPVLTCLALVSTAVTCALVVLTLRNLVVGAARFARASDVLARSIGTLVAMLLLMVMLAEITAAGLEERASVLAIALDIVWGAPMPSTPSDALLSIGVCLLAAGAACASALSVGVQQPLAVSWRIVALASSRSPRAFSAWVMREVLLYLRHPVTVVSLLTMLVIIACVSVAVRFVGLPSELALILFAVICAAGAETARGRVQSWSWVYRNAGVTQHRAVLAQLLALLVTQFTLLICAVVAAIPLVEVPSSLAQIAPTFVVLLALSHLAGSFMPYSDDAPVGALATSAVVLVAEIGWLTFDGMVLQHVTAWRPLVQVVVVVLAVAGSLRLASRQPREPRAARAASV